MRGDAGAPDDGWLIRARTRRRVPEVRSCRDRRRSACPNPRRCRDSAASSPNAAMRRDRGSRSASRTTRRAPPPAPRASRAASARPPRRASAPPSRPRSRPPATAARPARRTCRRSGRRGWSGSPPSSDCAPAQPYTHPEHEPRRGRGDRDVRRLEQHHAPHLPVRDAERSQQTELAAALHDADRQEIDEPDAGDHRRDGDEAHHDRREGVEDRPELARAARRRPPPSSPPWSTRSPRRTSSRASRPSRRRSPCDWSARGSAARSRRRGARWPSGRTAGRRGAAPAASRASRRARGR